MLLIFFFPRFCKVTKKYVEHLETARHGKLGGGGVELPESASTEVGGGDPEGCLISLQRRREERREGWK